MKKTILVLATIMLILMLCTEISASELQKNIVPADAHWVIHVNVEKIKTTRFFNAFKEEELFARVEKRGALLDKRFRFNPLEDIKGITLFGKKWEEDAVVCVHGNFDKDHLLSLLDFDEDHEELSYGKYTLHNWDSDSYGVFAKDDLVLFSENEAAIKVALDVLSGKRETIKSSPLNSLIQGVPSGAFLTGAAGNIAALLEGEHDKEAAILRKTEAAVFSLREAGENLSMNLNLKTADPKDAENIEQIVRGLLAMADMYKDQIPSQIKLPQDIKT
ncbi:MAG: hypothetical protein GQ544_01560, partial [Candidatus Aminicenantes bacterium]|nr:hypothetical protein [Candidatus Aminicenantes bacterium]